MNERSPRRRAPEHAFEDLRRKLRHFAGAGALLLPFLAMISVLLVYPVVRLVMVASENPDLGANIRRYVGLDANLIALRTTLLLSLLVTIGAVFIGTIVAWTLRTSRRRWLKSLLWATVFTPLLMNALVKVYSFTILLQRNGVINEVLLKLHLTQHPLNLLYNQGSVVAGMLYYMVPFAVLPLFVAFRAVDMQLIEVGESLGARRITAIRNICVPLVLPGVFATALIDFVICLGFFVIPLLLGGVSTRFTPNLIYEDLYDFYDLQSTAMSGVVLLAVALVTIAVGYVSVGQERMRRAIV